MPNPGTFLGRYEVRSQLGAGGMGEVFLAWDCDLDREVAIKVLPQAAGGDRAKRFLQEAKAAAGLHHPNVGHIYEIGSQDDLPFIAMEFVPGETLRARLCRAMAADEVLDLATQIAAGLGAAHKAGIIHRDIKPENVIITPDGYAKILDFGLAKLRESPNADSPTILTTTPGMAMGTIGYMAPEQLMAGDITPAADVYSLGVVMQEMANRAEGAPPKLLQVIARSLNNNAAARYRDGNQVLEALREISRSAMSIAAPAPQRRRKTWMAIAAATIVIAVIASSWMLVRRNRKNEAMRKIAEAESLVKQRRLAEAYAAAIFASASIPQDPRVADLLAQTSGKVTIESNPPGASVFLQRYHGPAERVRMGVTPLTIARLPRADYLLTLEKPGFAAVVRPISFMPIYGLAGEVFARPLDVRMKLGAASAVPPGMVFVEGGAYRLGGFQRPSNRLVEASDYFIDRYEVSNREFEEFVRAGGYRRRELWKHPFVDGSRQLSFEAAMERFRDTTGLSGPRSWSGGVAPAGRENHPVTDVTWYEAAAFAEWKGKRLPTVYQWEKAARPPLASAIVQSFPWGFVSEGIDATERSNFLGKGTMAVDTMPFGAGPYGSQHMAGNVAEWCRNLIGSGYAARGGSFSDNVYAFGQTAALPPMYSAPTLGFRCLSGGSGDEGGFALTPAGFVPDYKAVGDATFETFRQRYEYAHVPLEAKVLERMETADWTREKIAFNAAGKRVPAWLYLPKGFKPPLQVIHFAPAGDVVSGWRTLPGSIEARLAPLIRAGRAIFAVELEGFVGRPRPPNWTPPEPGQEEYVDYNVARVTEMRRGLDYVETRSDLDRKRIALLGISAGGGPGVVAAALESRYRSILFAGTGISPREKNYAAAANRIHFVPRIRAPKLMLHGRYDEDTSLVSEAEPMFRLMTEPKRLEIYDGIHVPPPRILMPALTKWFDETMGAVAQ